MEAAIEIGAGILKWIWGHKAWAVAIGLGVALLWSRHEISSLTVERDAQVSLTAASQHEEAIWKASYTGAAAALKDLRAQTDAQDARAKAQQDATDKAVAALITQRQADQAELANFRSQTERESHAPDATAAGVARSVLERLRD